MGGTDGSVLDCNLPAEESACMSIAQVGFQLSCSSYERLGNQSLADSCWMVIDAMYPHADVDLARSLSDCRDVDGFNGCPDLESECIADDQNRLCTFFEKADCVEATDSMVADGRLSAEDQNAWCSDLESSFNR